MVRIVGFIVGGLFLSIMIGTVVSLVMAVIMQILWNEFCGVFHLMKMDYWQMYSLTMFVWMFSTICHSNVKYE